MTYDGVWDSWTTTRTSSHPRCSRTYVSLARTPPRRRSKPRCVRCSLGHWLDSLPQGQQTLLGDGHTHVSGGERARIGMARALLADLPVLVLDEPTAHLDTATANAVAADLLDVASDRTVVWITHGTVGLDRVHQVLDLGAIPQTVRT